MSYPARYAILAVALLLACGLQIHNATSFLSFSAWPAWPFDPGAMNTDQVILAYAVLPRAVVAILAGAALGLTGFLFQQVLRNPIADASTLGISAGAQLAIVVATLFMPSLIDGSREMVTLLGAAAATAIVFCLGWKRNFEPVTMIISGLLVGITAGAVSAALTLAQGEYLMSLVTWNGGALSQQDWSTAGRLAIEFALALGVSALLVRPLHLLNLGDTAASSLGVSVVSIRLAVSAIGVFVAAGVSAKLGMIGFVGLAAPHLARAVGIRHQLPALVASALAGALLLWICDGVVQFVAQTSAEQFPTGAVTALIGGPLLLWLLPKIRHAQRPASAPPYEIRRAPRKGFLLLAVLVGASIVVSLFVGRTEEIWRWLSLAEFDQLLPMRWPRLLAACAAGGLLALSGAMLQRLTSNAMASPEVLGVSGGAGIGFAAALTLAASPTQWQLLAGAGFGAAVATLLVLAYAQRRHLEPDRLLLAGVAASSLSSAILGALLAVGDQRAWQILNWLGGSAATVTASSAISLAALGVVTIAIALAFVRWLTLLPLGYTTNVALGMPQRTARIGIIACAALATGSASLLVGPLSFVGLMGPHLARQAGFVRTREHLFASFALGAMLMLLADFGSRNLAFPYELPLGLFAALVGAPYLVWQIGWRK
ncbi:Fe(3+)-hydroxamate ABC transporter permease FhuB [Rhizobiaceae bacterium n13]|uniref:Fe(3+)-hydroxamate ABC transporter permease FhuB n=1 Tax=Ferirhizobium litorale TaxID=2927786 RepID=A0AAE3QAB3_9HYPH|nr:Fe(3+)-hydroxamate ABC transporter permease FhuB [Fererhizobium litorale]MDI7861576.1 Fe(3+)-hydroxamate ABC transporter permease FhuB [Fererhizobium litorale]MDI7922082.1 Fe(3+)-hydroxamate ABC transporter permease FhuB [Fererhizobium litorale]